MEVHMNVHQVQESLNEKIDELNKTLSTRVEKLEEMVKGLDKRLYLAQDSDFSNLGSLYED